jgi:hypothetical protein
LATSGYFEEALRVRIRHGLLIAGAPLFCALAIANAAGYQYGVSDLATYLAAAFRNIDPLLFPRDAALLHVQTKLTLADEAIALALRAGSVLGLSVFATVYVLHIGALLVLYIAAIALGRALFQSWWSVAALAAALTIRHAIPYTRVNTLEGYFHPRTAAFAIGVAALAVFLRRGTWPALAIATAGTAVHTITGLWFLICLGVAGVMSEPRDRRRLFVLGGAAALLAAAALLIASSSGRLAPMDADWLAVLASRTYLFPDRWPLDAWLICGGYVLVIAFAAERRRRAGRLTPRERGLLLGAAALLGIGILMLPPLVLRSALAVQVQPLRVFWILDLFATVSIIWLIAEWRPHAGSGAPAALALVLLAFSCVRGVYFMAIRYPERSIAAIAPAADAWQDAMQWAQSTHVGSHWLAHPEHAFLYGSSLRVSGRRDVLLDASKDPAVAIFDRALAMQVAERSRAASDFGALTAERVRELARRYELDYLITEAALPMPLAYQNARFNVYSLRP